MFKKFRESFDDLKRHYSVGLKNNIDDFNRKLNSFYIDKEFFDDDFFEELEEKLIELDILPLLAGVIADKMQDKVYNKKVERDLFQESLFDTIIEVLNTENNHLELSNDKLNILLIIGVNGVGKTTTISKLTNIYKNKFKVLLVAGDTFRAGAIEQLAKWSDVLGVNIIKTHQDHASSAVVYNACDYVNDNNVDLLICDTAGRLHNKVDLMNELKKIDGVFEKQLKKDFDKKNLLIIDATAGKNALEQAKAFNEISKIDGIIVSKFDANFKVGMIINIVYELRVPIYFITNGESVDNIAKFSYIDYLQTLFSEDENRG